MAVLIRDMKMPKRCINCPMCIDYCVITGNSPFYDMDVRPDWCPLQEVTLVAGMYKTQRKENADGN